MGFHFARPRTTPIVKFLLIANGVVFLLFVIAQVASFQFAESMKNFLGVSWEGALLKLQVWQFVTYLFVHGGPLHLLFNLLVLWMFGCEVESTLGRRKFLQLYFLSGIFAGMAFVVWGALDQLKAPAVGASGAIMAILVVFTMLAPNRTVLLFFMIPMKMKHLLWIIIGLDLYAFILHEDNGVANTAHLGGALFGFLWYRFTPVVSSVVEGFEKAAQERDEQRECDARAEVDRLLEKIAREGMASLTDKERKFLQNTSRRYYDPK